MQFWKQQDIELVHYPVFGALQRPSRATPSPSGLSFLTLREIQKSCKQMRVCCTYIHAHAQADEADSVRENSLSEQYQPCSVEASKRRVQLRSVSPRSVHPALVAGREQILHGYVRAVVLLFDPGPAIVHGVRWHFGPEKLHERSWHSF